MFSRRLLLPIAGVLSISASFVLVPFSGAQAERHGRKYKAPPETSHLEILVVKDANGKVLENAAVIFHPTKDGEDEGNLEVKSGVDGKAFIDVIPTGSDVAIQVISNGYATYAGTIQLKDPSFAMTIRMKRPTDQVSAYEHAGRDGAKTVGVQEAIHTMAPAEAPKPLAGSEPVIKLPSLPAKAKGDATIPPADHNVTPPPSAPAKPTPESRSPAPVTDGSPGTSSPSN
jgi:hypothetical protein